MSPVPLRDSSQVAGSGLPRGWNMPVRLRKETDCTRRETEQQPSQSRLLRAYIWCESVLSHGFQEAG
jgi:hypothetical protein